MTEDRSVLFIRSVALPIAQQALAQLRAAEPNARISVLTSPSAADAIASARVADDLLAYRPSRFGVTSAGIGTIASLRRRRFDVVVVPYSGAAWLPFWNVGRFALALSGRETRWLAADDVAVGVSLDACEPVSFLRWLRSATPSRRVRLAVGAAIKWPALLLATAATMSLLALAVPVLFVLLWLKPAPEGQDG